MSILMDELYPDLTNEERAELTRLSIMNNLSIVQQLRVMVLTGIISDQENPEVIKDIKACNGVISTEQAEYFIERILKI